MSLFDRFKKSNRSQENVYIEPRAQSRYRFAWLAGVAALVATLVIAAGVFFGGRAVYRALKDDKPTVKTGVKGPGPSVGLPEQVEPVTPPAGNPPQNTPAPAPTAQPTPSPVSNTRLPSTGPDIDL